MSDKAMIPYLVDNNIINWISRRIYEPSSNFEEFTDLIYNKLCN